MVEAQAGGLLRVALVEARASWSLLAGGWITAGCTDGSSGGWKLGRACAARVEALTRGLQVLLRCRQSVGWWEDHCERRWWKLGRAECSAFEILKVTQIIVEFIRACQLSQSENRYNPLQWSCRLIVLQTLSLPHDHPWLSLGRKSSVGLVGLG